MSSRFTVECPNPEPDKGTHLISIIESGNKNAGKTCICVHGLTRNAHDFDYLAKAIADDYRILAIDMPGRGQSQWLKNPAWYNYGVYSADIIHIFKELGLKNTHWVGTSLGGIIGMLIAGTMPQYIEKLVINDIGPFIPKAALERIGGYVGQAPVFKSRQKAADYLKEICASWGIKEDEHFSHLVKYSFRENKNGGYEFCYDPAISAAFRDENGEPKEMKDINMWEIWQNITCPVLVLRGKESDILPPSTALEMCRSERDIKLVEWEGIGHAPALMADYQIKIIRDWLC